VFAGKRLNILDIETTGFSRDIDRIIELGIIELVDGEVKTEYGTLFGGGRSSQQLVREVHKIRDEERIGLPTFEDRAEGIAKFLSNSILVGHNLKLFDLPFIETRLKIAGQSLSNIKVIDTCKISKKNSKVASNDNKLETLCEYFKIEYGAHRALADAKSTYKLLLALIEVIKPDKIEDLLER
jgi:DNA polymerase III epsilon subunit-like protein